MDENPYRAPREQGAAPHARFRVTWAKLVIGAFFAFAAAVNIWYLVIAARSPPGLTVQEVLPPTIMLAAILFMLALRLRQNRPT